MEERAVLALKYANISTTHVIPDGVQALLGSHVNMPLTRKRRRMYMTFHIRDGKKNSHISPQATPPFPC